MIWAGQVQQNKGNMLKAWAPQHDADQAGHAPTPYEDQTFIAADAHLTARCMTDARDYALVTDETRFKAMHIDAANRQRGRRQVGKW